MRWASREVTASTFVAREAPRVSADRSMLPVKPFRLLPCRFELAACDRPRPTGCRTRGCRSYAYEDIKIVSFPDGSSGVVDPLARTLPSLGSDVGTTRCACRVKRQSHLASCPPLRLRSRHDN